MPGSKPGSLPLADPRVIFLRAGRQVPCGNRTRLASLEGWSLCRSAKGTRFIRRKEGESNSQGREARPGSSGVPSPIGLSFRTCRLQQEGSNLHPLLNRQVDYRYPMLERESVKAAGFEPAISGSRNRRNPRLSHALNEEAPSGSRTRTSAMARRQATATSWAQTNVPNCQRTPEHGLGLGPRFPPYEGGVFAARRPVPIRRMGPDHPTGGARLEPSPTWLRARHAAANTLIPSLSLLRLPWRSARVESNHRLALIRGLL